MRGPEIVPPPPQQTSRSSIVCSALAFVLGAGSLAMFGADRGALGAVSALLALGACAAALRHSFRPPVIHLSH